MVDKVCRGGKQDGRPIKTGDDAEACVAGGGRIEDVEPTPESQTGPEKTGCTCCVFFALTGGLTGLALGCLCRRALARSR
ncbi:hypothetical protein [Kitasatospora sp. MBT66]|uniref:hypothetical protein n=1 Tax=Kitasatospora sp. MBT66 TaxID=1444769 RepID=UPI0005B7C6BB|nr:hypothetical protein [Kitasatospora sp. MBT66]